MPARAAPAHRGLALSMARRKRGAPRPAPRAAPVRPRGDAPTEQTVLKLRHDVVERLEREGRLRDVHLRASREIRLVWEAMGRGMFPMAAPLEATRQTHLRGAFRDPIERMTDIEEIVWRTRYRPWAGEHAVLVAAGTASVSRLQLVLDIVVDNQGLRQVEQAYRMRHGLAFEHLRTALQRYAELAGWVRPALRSAS